MCTLTPRAGVAPHGAKPPLPDPLPIAGSSSPCTKNGCRACCFDTRMPLLEDDIQRLERVTGKTRDTFTVPDEDGPPRLANTQGHCVFLDEHGCSVYDHRPAGCRLYPLVMDPETHTGVLDPDCPYTKGFRVRPRDRDALSTLVKDLGYE